MEAVQTVINALVVAVVGLILARMTHILLFRGLDRDSIEEILRRQLEGLRKTSELKGLKLTWESDLILHLASQWQPRFGVRFLSTILRHRIVEQLGIADAQGELKGVKGIRLEVTKADEKQPVTSLAGLATRRLEGDTLIIGVV